MSERNGEIRISITKIDVSKLYLPFTFIQKQFGYPVESILRKIHCESTVHLGKYPNTFPNTITEYYWISTEPNKWAALGKMENDLYFFYTAHCANTFVNGNGNMYLWVSTQYLNLIRFAMDEATYQVYINETAPL
jgi:hypothetical protein